jgi:periplasmic protein TonB
MTNFLIAIVFLLFLTKPMLGQEDTLKCKMFIDSLTYNEYYRSADTMPEYPGGKIEMVKFFMSNFNFVEPEASGKIIIEFTVNKEGQMEDFKIIRSLIEILDNEAIRVMKLMPKWKPGKCGDEAVNVKLVIPWIIRLE